MSWIERQAWNYAKRKLSQSFVDHKADVIRAAYRNARAQGLSAENACLEACKAAIESI